MFSQGVIQQQSTKNKTDEKLQQTMTLTVKRLDVYQQVSIQRRPHKFMLFQIVI